MLTQDLFPNLLISPSTATCVSGIPTLLLCLVNKILKITVLYGIVNLVIVDRGEKIK